MGNTAGRNIGDAGRAQCSASQTADRWHDQSCRHAGQCLQWPWGSEALGGDFKDRDRVKLNGRFSLDVTFTASLLDDGFAAVAVIGFL